MGCKICSVVGQKELWAPVAVYNSFEDEQSRTVGTDICEGLGLDPLCEVIDSYNNVSKPRSARRQRPNNINRYRMPGEFWLRQSVQSGAQHWFLSLALRTTQERLLGV